MSITSVTEKQCSPSSKKTKAAPLGKAQAELPLKPGNRYASFRTAGPEEIADDIRRGEEARKAQVQSEAAESTKSGAPPRLRASQRQQVLAFIIASGGLGATADEVAQELDLPYSSCSARCSELKRSGSVVQALDPRVPLKGATRPTRYHGDAAVWVTP